MSDSDGEVFEAPSAAAERAAEPEAEPAAAEAWWVEVVHKIIAGDKVPAALATLATQEKAQHFAREERLAAVTFENRPANAQCSILAGRL